MLRLITFLFTINCFAQDFSEGLVVVEFNAGFNKANVNMLNKKQAEYFKGKK